MAETNRNRQAWQHQFCAAAWRRKKRGTSRVTVIGGNRTVLAVAWRLQHYPPGRGYVHSSGKLRMDRSKTPAAENAQAEKFKAE